VVNLAESPQQRIGILTGEPTNRGVVRMYTPWLTTADSRH
jgi:hypothetical protein